MKIPAIRKLASDYDLETLKKLEEEIENGKKPHQPVDGDDEGDQLTHVSGAIWVKEQMASNNSDLKTELRNFSKRVRGSIS